jgi:hypothetical protein
VGKGALRAVPSQTWSEDKKMQINAKRLSELIEQELANVSDTRIVWHIRGLLVSPKIELRDWDYGSPGQQYPCWIVLSDAENSNTAIGYCEYGFGPRCPWGLLYCGDDPKHQSMGMDTGWFPTFLEAFLSPSPPYRYLFGGSSGSRTMESPLH